MHLYRIVSQDLFELVQYWDKEYTRRKGLPKNPLGNLYGKLAECVVSYFFGGYVDFEIREENTDGGKDVKIDSGHWVQSKWIGDCEYDFRLNPGEETLIADFGFLIYSQDLIFKIIGYVNQEDFEKCKQPANFGLGSSYIVTQDYLRPMEELADLVKPNRRNFASTYQDLLKT